MTLGMTDSPLMMVAEKSQRSMDEVNGEITSTIRGITRMGRDCHIEKLVGVAPVAPGNLPLPTSRTVNLTWDSHPVQQKPHSTKLLPEGWDVMPDDQEPLTFAHLTMLQRSGFMPSFDGTVDGFVGFKRHFIMSVHQTRLPIFAKYMALRGMLEKVPDLTGLINRVEPGKEGYGLMIHELEERYGGRERQLHRHVASLRFLPTASRDNVKSVQQYVDVVQGYHAALGSVGKNERDSYEHFNTLLYKLEPKLRIDYRTYCSMMGLSARSESLATTLLTWVKEVVLRPLRYDTTKPKKENQKPQENKRRTFVSEGGGSGGGSGEKGCPLCSGQTHDLTKCPKFIEMDREGKKLAVFKMHRCFRCLKGGHRAGQCTSDKCKYCNMNHHPLLCSKSKQDAQGHHIKEAPPHWKDLVPDDQDLPDVASHVALRRENPLRMPDPVVQALEVAQERSLIISSLSTDKRDEAVSLRYIVVNVRNPFNRHWTQVAALLDDGSNVSLVSEKLVEKLQLQGERRDLQVGGIGGKVVSHQACHTQAQIEHLNGKIRCTINLISMPAPVGHLTMTDWATLKRHWEHLKDLPFPAAPADPTVHLLIGNNFGYAHRSLEERCLPGALSNPMGRLTPFGWTATGPIFPRGRGPGQARVNVAIILEEEENPIINPEDRIALRDLYQELRQLPDGHYEVPVLWRGPERPGLNARAALSDWFRSRRRMLHQPEVYAQYHAVIMKWLDKGYIREVPVSEPRPGGCYHLTHFAVTRNDHQSTKVRVVMNARASFGGQVSLNDCILPGPKLINDLAEVLWNFRRFRFALSGDVQEMFLRIRMPAQDVVYHRFFFTPLGFDGVIEYEALVHLFGNRGSPAVAIFTVKYHAWKLRAKYPLGAEMVLHYSIVDDCMCSFRTVEEAHRAREELEQLFNECQMTVHKWAANHPDILVTEDEGQIIKSFVDFEEENYSDGRALGLAWIKGDFLGFEVPSVITVALTKRSALSINNSLFDPHGYLLPFKMVGRLLYKTTCEESSDWDTVLEEKLQTSWTHWMEDMQGAKELRIPRWLHLEELVAIHCFGDASSQAYGACVYAVTEAGTFLMGAKGHLVKSQTQTIPRLELEAAVTCWQLGHKISSSLGVNSELLHFWSDSLNCLSWIKAPSRQLEPYLARRVQRIREGSNPMKWRHVPTRDNPADLVSRGCSMIALKGSQLWWEGPEFLRTGDWPEERVVPRAHVELPAEAELQQLLRGFAGYLVADPLENAGTFLQGERVIKLLLHRITGSPQGPTRAFSAWCRYEQGRWFPRELEKAERMGTFMWEGVQLSLGPHRSLCMVGRVRDQPRQLLHGKSRLAKLWATHVHEQVLQHGGGPGTLSAEVRRTCWVWEGSKLFRQISRDCTRCRRMLPRPRAQAMAPLPPARYALQPMTVFQNTSLDFAGPWRVQIPGSRVRRDRYLLLFCCMSSRACALELTTGETSNDIMMGLQRFASRVPDA